MNKNLAIRFILAEGILFILLSFPVSLPGQLTQTHSIQKISIEWNKGRPSGTINVLNGSLTKIEIIKGPGKIQPSYHFVFSVMYIHMIAIK